MNKLASMFLSFLMICSLSLLAGPKIYWEKTTMDFGSVAYNSDGKRVFKFKNTGDQVLIIFKCVKSCGCTSLVCPTRGINPGETGEIEVTYNTKLTGPFVKNMVIYHNADPNKTELFISGTVRHKPDGYGGPNAKDTEYLDQSNAKTEEPDNF